MTKLKSFLLTNDSFLIHPLRSSDLLRQDVIVNDLFEIFGDIDTIPYSKEKYVKDKETLYMQLLGVTIGHSTNTRYTFFITELSTEKIIGEVIILHPETVNESYQIKDCWLIEYYLNILYQKKGIMTSALVEIIQQLNYQGITNIGAIVENENKASINLLQNCKFKFFSQINHTQAFYKWSI